MGRLNLATLVTTSEGKKDLCSQVCKYKHENGSFGPVKFCPGPMRDDGNLSVLYSQEANGDTYPGLPPVQRR